MAFVSVLTFSGLTLSTAADLRDTHWLRHLRSPSTSAVQWLLCFPPGTRPSGRVFFWSYVFYLSRYLQMVWAFIAILSRHRLSASRLFQLCHDMQVGLPGSSFPVIGSCQVAAIASNIVCHIGLAVVHLVVKGGHGGCNGIRTCLFNCVLNGAASIILIRFYMRAKSR